MLATTLFHTSNRDSQLDFATLGRLVVYHKGCIFVHWPATTSQLDICRSPSHTRTKGRRGPCSITELDIQLESRQTLGRGDGNECMNWHSICSSGEGGDKTNEPAS